jgi:TonB family protein
MYFDFEDYHPEIERVGPALTRLEVVLLSLVFHLATILAIVLAPRWFPTMFEPRLVQLAEMPPQDEPTRFVFVQPRNDVPAPQPPERADASDQDRMARTTERPPTPENLAPYMRGNTPEPVERAPDEASRGRGPEPEPAEGREDPPPSDELTEGAPDPPRLADARSGLELPETLRGRPPNAGGQLGDALRNLQRYVQQDSFNNPQGGGGQFGPEIQFDTKGVEFGPWVRRFVAQVKRNWLIPYAAMSMSGRVVITFNVHKNGALTDLAVVGPSAIDAFNHAAFGALASSNPTQPLPPEYPADKAFFTVTFFYNEPPQ